VSTQSRTEGSNPTPSSGESGANLTSSPGSTTRARTRCQSLKDRIACDLLVEMKRLCRIRASRAAGRARQRVEFRDGLATRGQRGHRAHRRPRGERLLAAVGRAADESQGSAAVKPAGDAGTGGACCRRQPLHGEPDRARRPARRGASSHSPIFVTPASAFAVTCPWH